MLEREKTDGLSCGAMPATSTRPPPEASVPVRGPTMRKRGLSGSKASSPGRSMSQARRAATPMPPTYWGT